VLINQVQTQAALFSEAKREHEGINPANMLLVFCHFADEIFGAIITESLYCFLISIASDFFLQSDDQTPDIISPAKSQLIFCSAYTNFVIN